MSDARSLRTRMAGPLEPYVPGFAVELVRDGYVATVVDLHVRLAAHLSGWLDREGLGSGDLIPEVVETYFAARRATGLCSHRERFAEAAAWLPAQLGASPASVDSVDGGPVETPLGRYGLYLRVERLPGSGDDRRLRLSRAPRCHGKGRKNRATPLTTGTAAFCAHGFRNAAAPRANSKPAISTPTRRLRSERRRLGYGDTQSALGATNERFEHFVRSSTSSPACGVRRVVTALPSKHEDQERSVPAAP